ncbi:unnamed protein product [Pleuronectes platessa]|uniref:Uncharacterized protein n=1 Tax=Pleuronectes platessa TaxID=8262 RepID=A0A9N7YGW3_PLEPL|nr:unnamed protein product [Pleuronectes platessa]
MLETGTVSDASRRWFGMSKVKFGGTSRSRRDKIVTANQPDIVVVNVVIPRDSSIKKKNHERLEKDQTLREQLERMWKGLHVNLHGRPPEDRHQGYRLHRHSCPPSDCKEPDSLPSLTLDVGLFWIMSHSPLMAAQ